MDYSEADLKRLLAAATRLGFRDDVAYYTKKLKELQNGAVSDD